jgi:hypothetical protein
MQRRPLPADTGCSRREGDRNRRSVQQRKNPIIDQVRDHPTFVSFLTAWLLVCVDQIIEPSLQVIQLGFHAVIAVFGFRTPRPP